MSASILDDVQFPNGQFVDLQVGEPCSLGRDATNRNAADGERADRESTDSRGDGQTPHLCADICNSLKHLTFNFTSVRERVKSSTFRQSPETPFGFTACRAPGRVYAAAMALALFNKASAIRILAMSMSLPSRDTAPFPSFAA